ncbi:Got1 family [Pyrenophora seminiperda CCB06]|uniref:Got1 family n=1 Tax=Pyrenophora seminiperda CCB06 TaxID=1302712 RepID=A0A3M7MCY5_9PLEO|nr:Got1 family [Pyrenophora seminiperda CCB06]
MRRHPQRRSKCRLCGFQIPKRLGSPSAQGILFLIGLTLIIGTTKTIAFFARRQKWKGTLAFVAGIALILVRWAFVGFVIELYGILVLFGDFLATIAGFVSGVPVVGPYVARALQAVGGVGGNADGGAV